MEEIYTCMKVDKTYFEISSKAFPKLSVKLLFPSQTSSMEEIEMINFKLISLQPCQDIVMPLSFTFAGQQAEGSFAL